MSDAGEYIKEISRAIGPLIHRPIGGLIISAVVGTLVTKWFVLDGGVPHPAFALAAGGGSGIAAFFVWAICHRIPKAGRGRIGIALAIRADTDEEYHRVHEDFVSLLQRALGANRQSSKFHAIIVPRFAVKRITDDDDAKRLVKKTRSALLLWGTCRRRTIDKEERHVLRLRTFVRHREVPPDVSEELANEIAAVLPERIQIPTENDALGFEVTSNHCDIAARYVIGMAAALSGDVEYAHTMLFAVEQKLAGGPHTSPIVSAMARGVTGWLRVTAASRCRRASELYRSTRTRESIIELERLSQEALKRDSNNYPAHLSAAQSAFLLRRSIDEAMSLLAKCKKVDDSAWRFSLAFLLAYNRDLTKASEEYKRAFRLPMNDVTVPLQCEEFIQSVMEEEPDRFELLYCLGILNYSGKRDLEAARRDFREFIKRCPKDIHPFARETAQKLIERIDEEVSEAA